MVTTFYFIFFFIFFRLFPSEVERMLCLAVRVMTPRPPVKRGAWTPARVMSQYHGDVTLVCLYDARMMMSKWQSDVRLAR